METPKDQPVNELRVVVIDDCPVIRRGICGILVDAGYCATCIEQLEPDAAIRFVHDNSWNLVILGIPLMGHAWLHLIKEIAHTRPTAHVLVLSELTDRKHEVAALRAGASGYLQRTSNPEEIIIAVRKTIEGGKFVSHDLIHVLVEQLNSPRHRHPEELLSEREFQVLRGLVEGKSTKELAYELHLSSKTVSTYRARICSKLNIHSNAGLVRYALKHKLMS